MDGWNYFNYFTEIEEYFWKKRGAHLLVSPLDWAIMEAWQKAGVPLEAVLKGIDKAFESYQRSRRGAGKALKSLAYCTDAVLEAAEEQQEAAAGSGAENWSAAAREAFSREELKAYFAKNVRSAEAAAEKHRLKQPEMAGEFDGNCEVAGVERYVAGHAGNAGSGRSGAAADDSGREDACGADESCAGRDDAEDPARSGWATGDCTGGR